MSQEKVERNKARKRNAKQINSQKKARRALAVVIVVAIIAGAVSFIGYSVYRRANPIDPAAGIVMDNTAIEDYFAEMNGTAEEVAEETPAE